MQLPNRLKAPALIKSNPVTTDGVTFVATVLARWEIQAGQDDVEIPILLRITNNSTASRRFKLIDSVDVILAGPNGKSLAFHHLRDSTLGQGQITAPVPPGKSFDFKYEARLVRAGGQLALKGPDNFGGTWKVDGLSIGSLTVRLRYKCHEGDPMESPVWHGSAITAPVCVSVRADTEDAKRR